MSDIYSYSSLSLVSTGSTVKLSGDKEMTTVQPHQKEETPPLTAGGGGGGGEYSTVYYYSDCSTL